MLRGAGLHSGATVTLSLQPAMAGAGINFVRTDLPGRPMVSVRDVEANSAPFRTVIKKGPAEVHTVEHLLSAFAGLGITDCTVEMDGVEVPGMDGSALNFVEAVRSGGIQELPSTSRVLVIERSVSHEEGIATISAQPFNGFKITYVLDYPGHPLAQGSYELTLSTDAYIKEIAAARTFAIKKDAEAMRAAGLGKGATLQNTVVIDGSVAIETTLRFANEPTRHKILDLIGDLYVLGRPVRGHITARCSGHRQNRALAAKLLEAHTDWQG
jgi:UDP-3-O-[3-hydroxymyristoyl] N-acetylglucosamine deacetylase